MRVEIKFFFNYNIKLNFFVLILCDHDSHFKSKLIFDKLLIKMFLVEKFNSCIN